MHSVRAISSVGSELLPYKQEVTGSNPVSPTAQKLHPDFVRVFYFEMILTKTCFCKAPKMDHELA